MHIMVEFSNKVFKFYIEATFMFGMNRDKAVKAVQQ